MCLVIDHWILQNYRPPEVWCQIGITYSQPDEKVTLYLNGHPVGMLDASGESFLNQFQIIFSNFVNQCLVSRNYNINLSFTAPLLFSMGILIIFCFLTGPFMGTMSDSSVGLAYLDCEPFFFTGCIDDVSTLLYNYLRCSGVAILYSYVHNDIQSINQIDSIVCDSVLYVAQRITLGEHILMEWNVLWLVFIAYLILLMMWANV